MSFLLRSFALAARAPVKPHAGARKIQSANIHNVSLVQLHDQLYATKEPALQLHGIRLHKLTEATSSVPLSKIARELREANSRAFREIEFRRVHGFVRDIPVAVNAKVRTLRSECFLCHDQYTDLAEQKSSQAIAAGSIAVSALAKNLINKTVPEPSTFAEKIGNRKLNAADLDANYDL